MRNSHLLVCLFASALATAAGCTSHTFNVDDDAGDNAKASADATSGDSGRDARTDVSNLRTSCVGFCGKYDDPLPKGACNCDEQCTSYGDCCSDYKATCAAPATTWVCGNSKCEAGETASNCPADCAVPTTTCVDNDKDGYCDAAPKSGDCNDNNANVHPGAVEVCGNNVDDNCNGQVDEGCDTPPATSSNSLTVVYPDSATRRLSYGLTNDYWSIPYVWNVAPQGWVTGTTLTVNLGDVQQPASNCLYLRYNVDEPSNHWRAMGNTSASKSINLTAKATINLLGKTYGNSSLKPIVVGSGSSVLLVVSFNGATCKSDDFN